MTETCPILGAKSYLTLADETDWGVKPASPTYYYCPVTNYGVRLQTEKRRSKTYCGVRQGRHGQVFRASLAGQITAPFFGWIPTGAGVGYPLARKLLDWGFGTPESICPASKLAEWAEGPDTTNKRHLGLRVNQATLSGTADSGEITIALDLLGRSEEQFTTAQTLPDDQESLIEADFADVLFELDLNNDGSYAVVQIAQFQWQFGRGAKVRFQSGTLGESGRIPSQLNASGDLTETFNFTMDKADDTWDDIARQIQSTEFAARLTIYASHNSTGATGTHTKLVIAFPRLSWNESPDAGGMGELSTTITADVLKPNSSTAARTLTWSEVSGTGTTTSTTTAGE
jgi:hypothetical protein